MKETCKYCKRKGEYSFGWLDSNSVWQDQHLTCKEHAPVSLNQQQFRMEMEQLRERSRNLFTRKDFLITNHKEI